MFMRRLLFLLLALVSAGLLSSPQPETITNEVDADTGELMISIEGQAFGAGPEVLFFHDFRGVEDGTLVTDTEPAIGNMTHSHGDPTVGSHLGNKGFWVVNEDRGRNTHISAIFDDNYQDVFIAYSVVVPANRTGPAQTEIGQWGGSTWKFTWLLQEDRANNNGSLFDLVLPQQNGNSGSIHGNASQFRLVDSGSAANIAPMSDWWEWGNFNHMSGWVRHDPDDSTRSSGNFSVSNHGFGFQSFDTTADHRLVGPGPSVSRINFPGWVRYTDEDNFQALYSDIYVAGGPNMLARIEITDSAQYDSSRFRKVLAPTDWTGDSIETSVSLDVINHQAPLYIHVFNAAGERSASGLPACQRCPVMSVPEISR